MPTADQHLGANVWNIQYKPTHQRFRYGLSGTFRKAGLSTYRNTAAMAKPQIQLTNLYLWNDPNYKQFEAISTNIPRLDSAKGVAPTYITPKWPNVSLPPGNQMCCGCCWAYSLAKTAFARYQIQTGQSLPGQMFSVDAIIACTLGKLGTGDQQPQCNGCGGGDLYSAWDILQKTNTPFQLVPADKAFQATNAVQSSGNECGQLEACNPAVTIPNAQSSCKDDPDAYTCDTWNQATKTNFITGPGPVCQPVHVTHGGNKIANFAIIPYWSGADPSQAGAGLEADASVQPALNNFVFFAAAIQHEIAHSGPVQFGMNILNLTEFQNYQPGQLILFTPILGQQPAGHAMMITGWHWVDMKSPLVQSDIGNFSTIKDSYQGDLDNPKNVNVYQLVWTIQNQWAQPAASGSGWSSTFWGMNNSAHVAAAFYICVDKNGNNTPKVLPFHSTNFMEMNAVAGNFWPPAAKKPSVARLLADHVASFGMTYVPTASALQMEADYLLPSIFSAVAPMAAAPMAAMAPMAAALDTSMALTGGLVGSVTNTFPAAAVATAAPRALPTLASNLIQRAHFQLDPTASTAAAAASEMFKDTLNMAAYRRAANMPSMPAVAFGMSNAFQGATPAMPAAQYISGASSCGPAAAMRAASAAKPAAYGSVSGARFSRVSQPANVNIPIDATFRIMAPGFNLDSGTFTPGPI